MERWTGLGQLVLRIILAAPALPLPIPVSTQDTTSPSCLHSGEGWGVSPYPHRTSARFRSTHTRYPRSQGEPLQGIPPGSDRRQSQAITQQPLLWITSSSGPWHPHTEPSSGTRIFPQSTSLWRERPHQPEKTSCHPTKVLPTPESSGVSGQLLSQGLPRTRVRRGQGGQLSPDHIPSLAGQGTAGSQRA